MNVHQPPRLEACQLPPVKVHLSTCTSSFSRILRGHTWATKLSWGFCPRNLFPKVTMVRRNFCCGTLWTDKASCAQSVYAPHVLNGDLAWILGNGIYFPKVHRFMTIPGRRHPIYFNYSLLVLVHFRSNFN
jgi:hypothetical protein